MSGGTVMQASKLPFRYWFIALHMVISTKKVSEQVWVHQATTVPPKEAGKAFPWVHTMISNAKRNLLGIHHMISKKYYQDYLDEFCYKVNRRYFEEGLFDRLLIAYTTINYKDHIHVNR